jgi:streptogramin lyase
MEACLGGQCVNRMTDFPIILPDRPGGIGAAEDITTGPDGNLWFTDQGANAIGRMTPDGNTTEFPLATATSYPQGLAAGPDGRLWFAEYLGPRIGAITTAGVITEYPLPGGLQASDQVVSGPGGHVWFLAGGGIGFFTTDGVGTLVTGPPHATSEDAGITVGPDGNLWTAGYDGIYRTTPNGTMTKLPIAGNIQPLATRIARGPDGNLWFTENYPTQQGIGRMTPDGVATEFQLLPAVTFRFARDIVSAPDGNLWFTEPETGVGADPNAAAIGRITPDGTITEFLFDGDPFAMTVGPDGNLWYTDPNAFKIVRFIP